MKTASPRRGRRAGATLVAVLASGVLLAPQAGAQISDYEILTHGLAPGNAEPVDADNDPVLPDASRLYFTTEGSLTADDTDGGLPDLYEGTGSQTRLISTSEDNPDGADRLTEFWFATPDGSRVLFSTRMALDDADTDEWTDVYVRVGNETHLASPNPDDDIADDADAVFQDNSPDGTRVWFGTDEPLVAEDQDLWYDLYEWAGVDGEVELLSTGPLDEPDPPDSEDQEFMDYEGSSDDGSRVYFSSEIALTEDDTDDESDIYLREGDVTTLATPQRVVPLPEDGSADTALVSVSSDGSRIYLISADGFVAEDTDERFDVYAVEAGEATLLTPGTDDDVDYLDRTSGAARLFFTTSEALVGSDTDESPDVYERSGGQYALLTSGPEAQGGEFEPDVQELTSDGSRLFFHTEEQLVAADDDDFRDVYMAQDGAPTLISDDDTGDERPQFEEASADGTRVLYRLEADDLYLRDDGPPVKILPGEVSAWELSSDGSRLVFWSEQPYVAEDTDFASDFYRATLAFPPENTAPPAITGTPAVGQALTCSPGTWTGGALEYVYRWSRGGTEIPGATTATYVAAPPDSNKQLTCTVTATNGAGSASATSAAVTVQPAGGPAGPPPPPPRAGHGSVREPPDRHRRGGDADGHGRRRPAARPRGR